MRNSNILSTAVVNPSVVLKLMFVAVILLMAMPSIAQQSKPDAVGKHSWRVIDDMPYRIIPAHPPLKTSGETLKELDFDSIETLLSGVDKRSYITSVTFSPDAGLIAAGSDDNTVRLWDLQAKKLVHQFNGHAGLVTSVAFSPDGRLITSVSYDKTLRLWDVQARKPVHTIEGHQGRISSVVFSPDGRLIATGSEDNTVRLWDMQAKTLWQILLEGNRANWLSIVRQRYLLRGNDGTLLKRRANKNGSWLPVPVAGQSGQGKFLISVVPDHIALVPGESREISIRVTNFGSQPAYWLHLEPSTSRDGALRLDPPDQRVKGQGDQAWPNTENQTAQQW